MATKKRTTKKSQKYDDDQATETVEDETTELAEEVENLEIEAKPRRTRKPQAVATESHQEEHQEEVVLHEDPRSDMPAYQRKWNKMLGFPENSSEEKLNELWTTLDSKLKGIPPTHLLFYLTEYAHRNINPTLGNNTYKLALRLHGFKVRKHRGGGSKTHYNRGGGGSKEAYRGGFRGGRRGGRGGSKH